MPAWAGKWKGGRYYLVDGKPVFFIERRGRSVKLTTHDEDLAVGELARFLDDPVAYCRPAPVVAETAPVLITEERIRLYLESIHAAVSDHRKARASYLAAWALLGLDLRTVDRRALRAALASFDGGHRGRTEALNAFARFLVREGDLASWNPLVNTREPEATRAERQAYDLKTLGATFKRLDPGPVRDLFHLRAATGMHHTEIEQLEGAEVLTGPMPERGVAVRVLPKKPKSRIAGVVQVMHKSRRRHRQSLDRAALDAVLRLRERVPDRVTMWEQLAPLTPSNLRHTFVTLSGEVGELVTYEAAGVDRGRIAQIVGHRAGSTMTADRYDKVQVPPLIVLPLPWVKKSGRRTKRR